MAQDRLSCCPKAAPAPRIAALAGRYCLAVFAAMLLAGCGQSGDDGMAEQLAAAQKAAERAEKAAEAAQAAAARAGAPMMMDDVAPDYQGEGDASGSDDGPADEGEGSTGDDAGAGQGTIADATTG